MMWEEILGNILSAILQILLTLIICSLLYMFRRCNSFLSFIGINRFEFSLNGLMLSIFSSIIAVIFFKLISQIWLGGQIDNVKFSEIGFYNGIIAFVVKAAISEEILFRGAIQNLAEKYFSYKLANTLQSALFAIIHVPAFIGESIAFCFFAVLFVFFSAIWMSILNRKFGNKSIYCSFLFHSLTNIFSRI